MKEIYKDQCGFIRWYLPVACYDDQRGDYVQGLRGYWTDCLIFGALRNALEAEFERVWADRWMPF